MLTPLANLFRALGWSRDDTKWLWSQLAAGAAAIASGVFNITYWATYVGLTVTPTQVHIITVVAVIILWVSGHMDTSPLPSAPVAKALTEATAQATATVQANAPAIDAAARREDLNVKKPN